MLLVLFYKVWIFIMRILHEYPNHSVMLYTYKHILYVTGQLVNPAFNIIIIGPSTECQKCTGKVKMYNIMTVGIMYQTSSWKCIYVLITHMVR